jgi:mono/diheme cytochrome c family protein
VYGFATGEETALTTIPPQEDQPAVFVPQTPTLLPPPLPTSTRAPEVTDQPVVLTWDGSVGALFQKCTTCHGAEAQTAGLNLNTYADALAGSSAGPVIVPGSSAASGLVQIQQAGGHPGQLLPDEIALIIAWIDQGAPEK